MLTLLRVVLSDFTASLAEIEHLQAAKRTRNAAAEQMQEAKLEAEKDDEEDDKDEPVSPSAQESLRAKGAAPTEMENHVLRCVLADAEHVQTLLPTLAPFYDGSRVVDSFIVWLHTSAGPGCSIQLHPSDSSSGPMFSEAQLQDMFVELCAQHRFNLLLTGLQIFYPHTHLLRWIAFLRDFCEERFDQAEAALRLFIEQVCLYL